MRKCLIDAGSLIALFDRSDRYHKAMRAFMRSFHGRLVTSWAVVTETLHMLDFNVNAQLDFLRWMERGALDIPVMEIKDLSRIITYSEKYADVPMDFADATLILLSENEKIRDIITIDSDFHVYRDRNREALNNLFHIHPPQSSKHDVVE